MAWITQKTELSKLTVTITVYLSAYRTWVLTHKTYITPKSIVYNPAAGNTATHTRILIIPHIFHTCYWVPFNRYHTRIVIGSIVSNVLLGIHYNPCKHEKSSEGLFTICCSEYKYIFSCRYADDMRCWVKPPHHVYVIIMYRYWCDACCMVALLGGSKCPYHNPIKASICRCYTSSANYLFSAALLPSHPKKYAWRILKPFSKNSSAFSEPLVTQSRHDPAGTTHMFLLYLSSRPTHPRETQTGWHHHMSL